MKKIIAVNAGSSSLKFKLFEMPAEVVVTEGVVERIGMDDAIFTIKVDGVKHSETLPIKDHSVAVNKLLSELVSRGIVQRLDEITGVGHRLVHGGWYFSDSVVIDDEVISRVEELCSIAPLHNPANLTGVHAFKAALPNASQVGVFDTSFHQTMAPEAYMYAVPYDWYETHKMRKYGFHGTSHKFVAHQCAEVMGKDIKDLKIITCHIGNGASISAVKGGKCVDTSMGLTPLEGIPMGTRSGNLDPSVLEHMAKVTGKTLPELVQILNKKSGYLGVSGVSNDSRDLENAAAAGNAQAQLALDIQYKRVADYIGSYYVYMGGCDAIVFTAGIGENSAKFRKNILDRVSCLGVTCDEEANNVRGKVALISTPESKIKAYLIPTDEELCIARDVVRLG